MNQDKNIYALLNEADIDFTEYENAGLSSEERGRHRRRILQEVRKTEKGADKKAKRRRAWKTAA